MYGGKQLFKPLEGLDMDQAVSAAQINAVCDALDAHNQKLLGELVDTLKSDKGRGQFVEGLEAGFARKPETLYKLYFGSKAYSFQVPQRTPTRMDIAKSALQFYMSLDLQRDLLSRMRGVPDAEVMNAELSANSDAFIRIHRHIQLGQMVHVAQFVQGEIERWAWTAGKISGREKGIGMVATTTNWVFDFDVMNKLILLGFMPSLTADVLNSYVYSSNVVAGAVLRTHLESVFFQTDFHSVMSQRPSLRPAVYTLKEWQEALKKHVKSKALTQAEYDWLTALYYDLLSKTVHVGLTFTYGEVWTFIKITEHARERIATVAAATP